MALICSLRQVFLRQWKSRTTSGLRGFLVIGTTKNPLSPDVVREVVMSIMSEDQRLEFQRSKECNFAISQRGIGRFRVSAYYQRNLASMVLRLHQQT